MQVSTLIIRTFITVSDYSHSCVGAGSILDAKRFGVPLVVVVNESLHGNHQLELAEEVERSGWAVLGDIGYVLLRLSMLYFMIVR